MKLFWSKAIADIVDPNSNGEVLVKQVVRITLPSLKSSELDLKEIEVTIEDLVGVRCWRNHYFDESTGEIIADANSEIGNQILKAVEAGISSFSSFL